MNDSQATKADRAAYKSQKDAFKVWQREQLHNARNLSKAEFEAMKDRRDLLEADYLAIEKYRLANWSDTAPESVTIEQIERDDKGHKRKALERLEKQAFPVLAIAADKSSKEVQEKWGAGIAHQDITHLALAQKALEQIGVHEFLDFALAGNSWDNDTAIASELASKLRELRNFEVTTVNKFGKSTVTKIDKLAEIGIHLMCGKDVSNNAYVGSLLQWLGLATNSKKVTIDSKRVRVYSLCQSDLSITRDELSRRAARMIREGLELIPSHAFVEKLIDLSIPSLDENIKGCGHHQNEIPQSTQDEGIDIEKLDHPNVDEPIATIPIAQTSQKLVNISTAIGPGAIAQPIFKTDTAQNAIATGYLFPEKIEYEYF
jgi:hypothetical protein